MSFIIFANDVTGFIALEYGGLGLPSGTKWAAINISNYYPRSLGFSIRPVLR